MPKRPYKDLIREAFHGNKFLETGEINPQYNPKWGLTYGRYYRQAKDLMEHDRELFLGKSTTEQPIEYTVLGMVSEKAQYQFRELEKEIKGYGDITDARTRAVDISRLSNFLDTYASYGSTTIKDSKTGQEIEIENPVVYAELYAEGKISRTDFFEKIRQWQQGVEYIAQHKNNYD